MNITFINPSGKEQVVDSFAEFTAALRDGNISRDALAFDDQEQRWKKASEIVESRAAAQTEANATQQDVSPVSKAEAQGTNGPMTPKAALNNVGQLSWRVRFLAWARTKSGPTVYAAIVGLGYVLVKNLALAVPNAFLTLTDTLIGAVGFIVGIRGLFVRRKAPARWEQVVATAVVVSVIASFGAVVYHNRQAKAMVALTHSKLQSLSQAFTAEVNASGVNDVFEMLSGQRALDRYKIVETRGHIAELIASAEATTASAQHYLQECKADLSPADPNAVFLEHLSQALTEMSSIKRDYFTEIGKLLDLLISEGTTYRHTSEGPRFHTQNDPANYNALMSQIISCEKRMSAIASDMKEAATPAARVGRPDSAVSPQSIVSETCHDPHERLGSTGVCWCEPGYRRDPTTLTCVK